MTLAWDPTTPPPVGPMSMTGPMWMPTRSPTFGRMIAWHPQPIPLLPALAVGLLAAYLVGTAVLHRRGVRWPVHRTVWWVAGVATLLAVTGTGVDGYGMELFSVHMVQHMVLNMLTPVLLVLGAPITLLLRALPSAGAAGRVRRGLLRLMHSRFLTALTHPMVTFVLFITSLYGLYFTPVFDWLMSTWWGHNLMLVHFLVVGFLYFWSLLGVDPNPRLSRRGPRSLPSPMVSVMEIGATAPFHAFFGVAVMMSTTLLVRFYAHPMPGWGVSALADQASGGGIAWAFTEIPTLLVLGALLATWQRSDERRNRAAERRWKRGEDTDLERYNAYLQALARADQERA
ncbi:cytochrome c oxidase assembly protein [Isoptericola sp. b441]|uniref:Cytochrome c oxidase assembly protein n=1 Tax=Actinotalea lenta TaxID=3064654 RepID=A0ABT9DEL7_9CELL|nr:MULTISPECIES: cytochrome c oxidase assembly protein [unclassified Isoptericola]MDO8108026.1 cytochrome c oxidase assembly protein [Isoptericola sp. b441]MDO8120304.1 cytochrome c oxidase assembly protein [Isoptericola sp. b490]